MLEDEKERKRCLEVVDEARERVETMVRTEGNIWEPLVFKQKKNDCFKVAEKRKKSKNSKIDEDDPDKVH